jgi:hypothetical protein
MTLITGAGSPVTTNAGRGGIEPTIVSLPRANVMP